MKLLGIDFGQKHLGLAIAEEETGLASPFKVIGSDLAVLKKILEEEKIGKIIIGLPKSLGNSENEQYKEAQAFVELLKQESSLPIETADERLSTVMANRLMGEDKKKGERDDAVAAMLILQGYLDKK